MTLIFLFLKPIVRKLNANMIHNLNSANFDNLMLAFAILKHVEIK